MANIPIGTVTFLFTDIEGSTALWENYPVQMETALARHDEILCATVKAHEGYVFKMVGDACYAAFNYPREALRAALAAQRTFFVEQWNEPISFRVRMALHTGATEERDGDYFGPPVNRVARLLTTAHGGQVLLSGATHNFVRDHTELVAPEARLLDLGEYRLKDLTYPEHIFQLAVPDLPDKFPPLRADKTPDDFDNRYRFKDFLGSGGMAKVYLAHDEMLERDVAIKVLHPRYVDDEELTERFKREARSAAKLSHPSIVPIYDRGEKKDGTYYMVMEHLPGGTLKDLIVKEAPLPPRTAVALTLQIAQALEVAHAEGVIHRDVKPQNILLTRSGEAKVADFGIAKAVSSSTMLTHTGAALGTPHYIAPEQAEGAPASFRSDLYALGVVLYEMLTGELPYDAETPVGIAMKQLRGQLRSPKEINPNVPEQVTAVVLRLLASDPEARCPDAIALIEDLTRVLRSLEDSDERVVEQPSSSGSVAEDYAVIIAKEDPELPTVRVPNLVGKNAFQASSTLANEGLTLGDQKEVPSETVPEGEILGQTPEGGTEVKPGSLVSVTVSLGPEERATPRTSLPGGLPTHAQNGGKRRRRVLLGAVAAMILAVLSLLVAVPLWNSFGTTAVPDLKGKTVGEAVQTVGTDFKLEFSSVWSRDVTNQPKGTIVYQEPSSGERASRGSVIELSLSGGQEDVKVPDVDGLNNSQAAKVLIDAGLQPEGDYYFDQSGNPVAKTARKRVYQTDPPAGTLVQPGKVISFEESS